MSVYVDDLTFSGALANKRLERDVEHLVKSAGLVVHPGKTQLFKKSAPKLITGVVVQDMNLKVRNKHHQSIYNLFNERDMETQEDALKVIDRKLLGHLNAAGQIDSKFKQKAKTFRSTKGVVL